MSLAPGDLFAGYTVVRLLGTGGMGAVYLVDHPRLPRRDAIKVLLTSTADDPSFRDRFNLEAARAAALWHPHIVGVRDRGEHDGHLWIAMEYVDGSDAAHLLAAQPTGMPPSDVADIVTAVAGALDYAHKNGILHRDVKPANIMVTDLDEDGQRRILLADFGIARPMDDTNGLTATNTTIGTIAYSAPEQLMGEPIDGRADQYALAATAYHLLTGTTLFPLDNQAAVISHHLTAPPPALAAKHPELAAIDTALARALSKKPEQRYARCVDFARAFHEATTSQGAAALAPTTQAPTSAPESEPTQAAAAAPPKKPAAPKQPAPPATATPPLQNRRRAIALGAAAAVAIIAVPTFAAWRPWDSPTTTPPTVSASPALEATPAAEQSTQPLPPPTTPTPKHGVAGMVVMLDPALSGGDDQTVMAQSVEDGRGGRTACQDMSATTQSGYPEHTFAWDTTLRARALLTQEGVRTAMTRGNDNQMGPCVDERAAIANDLPMHPNAIVSIRAYSADANDHGFLISYPSLPRGERYTTATMDLAHSIHSQLVAAGFTPATHTGINGLTARSDLAELNLADYPAIQIALGNTNNATDAEMIETVDGRQKYADAIVQGLTAALAAQ